MLIHGKEKNMDFVLVSENSTLLSYGDEKYDVTELPQNTSLIVEEGFTWEIVPGANI